MLATLPLTLARISIPDAEPAEAEPLRLGQPGRVSGEVAFRWIVRIEDETVAQTVARLRPLVPELDELCLERIGTSPGGVWVLRCGEVRAPIFEGDAGEVIAALNVLLSHASASHRFVPMRSGDDVIYAAMGAEEAVELLHGRALTLGDLGDLLDYAAF
jgi:hypothetical protein